MRSGFARLHPLVDLTFFVLVLAFAMFLSHPAVQLAGLVCGRCSPCAAPVGASAAGWPCCCR